SSPARSCRAWPAASTTHRGRTFWRTTGAAPRGCARCGRASSRPDAGDDAASPPPRGARRWENAPAMCPRLFVLDGPGYLFRAYHALPYLSTSKGVPVNTVLGMSTMLWKLFREERPDYFAVAWDPPGPTFRDEKFSAYKETRAAPPDDLKRQIPFVMQVLAALRVPVLEVAGFEADDVLGTMVDRARAHDVDVVLVTQDKDMLQLVGPRVTVLAPSAKAGEQIVYDTDRVREKWGVGPEQIPDLLALMGDSIDNIPGVPGIGQKTAVKLIGQFGSVEGL